MATDARGRILEAACDLIASEGIDEVRIARVATKARASTALVHHYFSTREELLEQALLHSYETAGAERFAGGDEDLTATAALAQAIDGSLPLPGSQERDWTLWVELWLRAVRDPRLRPLAADLYDRYREWLAGLIQDGFESGEFELRALRGGGRRARDRGDRRRRHPRPDPRPGDRTSSTRGPWSPGCWRVSSESSPRPLPASSSSGRFSEPRFSFGRGGAEEEEDGR